jgi:hypothetical protein
MLKNFFVRNLQIFVLSLSFFKNNLEKLVRDKYSSFIWKLINYGQNKFYNIDHYLSGDCPNVEHMPRLCNKKRFYGIGPLEKVEFKFGQYFTIEVHLLNVMFVPVATCCKTIFAQLRPNRVQEGKSYWRGRLCTVDLLVLTSADQLLFMLKILFT